MLKLSNSNKLAALIFSVILLLILSYVTSNSAEIFPQALLLITSVSLPVAGGLITLSFCSLLGAFSSVGSSAISHPLTRISENPARNFFFGFLITAYLSLVRPPLAVNLTSLPYIEWTIIAVTVYVVYDMTRQSTKKLYLNSEDLGWKRHEQKIRRETGRELIRASSVMEQFVEHGVKEPLLVYLALHMQRLGENEEGILKTLSPLVDYREDIQRHRLRFLIFPRKRRNHATRSKETRENLLNALLKKIDRLRSE